MEVSYKKYVGIPFKHLGRDRSGLDCYGLLIYYYKEEFGIEIPDWYYSPQWSKEGCNYFMENYETIAFKVDTPRVHDVVLFYTDIVSKVVNHAGILVELPSKVLQVIKSGVSLTDFNTPVLKKRIEGFYRLKCLR